MKSDITEFPGAIPLFLSTRLGEWLDRLEAAAARLRSPEPDDEAVHDVRVATRRLRGGLAAARPALRWKGRTRRLYRELGDLRRELGRAREREVALRLLDELRAGADPAERAVLAALSLRLTAPPENGPDQAARSRAVERRLDRVMKRGRRLVARLEVGRGLTRPAAPAESPEAALPVFDAAAPAGPPSSAAPDRLRALAIRAIDQRHRSVMGLPLEPLRQMDDGAQHRFRIEVKKLRYTMEFFAPLFSKKLQARVALLKAIQDLLGELHDLADLGRLAESARAHGGAAVVELGDGLARLAGRLEARRHRQSSAFEPLYSRLAHPGFPPRPASVAAPGGSSGGPGGSDPPPGGVP